MNNMDLDFEQYERLLEVTTISNYSHLMRLYIFDTQTILQLTNLNLI
jgi:hypothetical protein